MFVRLLAGMLGISVVLCSAVEPAFAQPTSVTTPVQQRRNRCRSACRRHRRSSSKDKGKNSRRRRFRPCFPPCRTSRRAMWRRRTRRLPTGDLVGVNPAVRRHRFAGRDHDGAPAQHRSLDQRIEQPDRELPDRRRQGRLRRAVSTRAAILASYRAAGNVAVPGGPERWADHADYRRGERPRSPVWTSSGGRYSLSGSQQAIQNNAALNSYNPYYQTAIALQFTQPLLRGAGDGSPIRRQLVHCRANAQAASAQLLVQASQTVTNVSNTYWISSPRARRRHPRRRPPQRAGPGRIERTFGEERRCRAGPNVVESYTQVKRLSRQRVLGVARVQALQTHSSRSSSRIPPTRCGWRIWSRPRPYCSFPPNRNSTISSLPH